MSHHFILLDRFSLSPQTMTCLKGAGINKVDEVLEMSRAELHRIRKFWG